MSLSQKHAGKILVPWFNVLEWHEVYKLIYCDDDQDLRKALDVLKIWKNRTPLLSAGVEGTLIILQALLTSSPNNFETTHVYSTALVRFLNLCATNSDKQGTFYKKAKKNDLPKWLINLRHEIAHSHKIPSKSVLELSLNYCLNWLKLKYWDVQPQYMINCIVESKCDLVEHIANAYVYLNVHVFYYGNSRDYGEKLERHLKKLMKWKIRKNLNNDVLLEFVKNQMDEVPDENLELRDEFACSALVDEATILLINPILDDSRNKIIPDEFLNIWKHLIGLLVRNRDIWRLLDKLHDFSAQGIDKNCEVASLWISEIYKMLPKEEKDILLSESRQFMDKVINQPNNFTLNYLKKILIFNEASANFIEDSINLVSACISINTNFGNSSIFSADFLKNDLLENETNNDVASSNSRWKPIIDTSILRNCPLGVLPHQSRDKNPVLVI